MPTEDQNKELADKVEEIIQYLDLDEIDGLYYGFGWNGVMYVNQ